MRDFPRMNFFKHLGYATGAEASPSVQFGAEAKPMDPEVFFQGDSEMAQRMRQLDWTCKPLGSPERWPQALRSPLDICLGSSFPIAIYWGPDLSLLYNDAWSPILGGKHPWALGRPAREVWPEIWDTIGPQFDQVLTSGVATRSPDQLLPMHRQGFTEECWFDYTFSPIRGADGRVAGIFNAVVETTFRHIGERRTQLLRHLAESVARSDDADAACQRAAAALASDPSDLPFALLYLREGSGLRLAASCGLPVNAPAALERLDPAAGSPGWPMAEVLVLGQAVTVEALAAGFTEPLPGGPWPEPCARAVLMPLAISSGQPALGVMVAGISPRLVLESEYRAFVERTATAISNAIAGAQALQQERARAEALAELDRAKTSFFTNVSHELRTPLTLMLGPIEEALGDVDVGPIMRERLDLAHRNSLRLLKLVNSLLDFARIEAGRMKLELQPTDLAAFTQELTGVFRATVERAGLTFDVECQPLAQPVAVDRDAWEKVVLNLLSNAFKYTLRGGIKVSLAPIGEQVRLSVHDTGVGIPARELPHVFQRFHRVEGSVGRTHEGTGIGLALVQELVKLHGGTIQVDSEPGRGSSFVVTLPAQAREEVTDDAAGVSPTSRRAESYVQEASRWLNEPQPDGQPPVFPADAHGLPAGGRFASTRQARVLLADDNADMRQYLSRLLRPWWRVEAVSDGIQAVAAARRERPDLILSDVMMSRLDGFGVLAAVRAEPDLSSVPVILLSARAGEESRIEGMHHGADDYLVKPFSARELLARVGAHLELGRVRREAAAALQRSRQQLNEVVGSIRDQFLALDADWRYTFVNDRVTAVTGHEAGQLLGRSLWEAFPRLNGTEFERRLREIAAKRMPERFVYDDSAPDGERRYANHVYPTQDGGLSLLVIDITDSRRREENATFLASIGDIMARSLEPAALMEEVGQRIGEYLRLSSCAFNEVDDKLGVTTVQFGWFRNDVPSLVGGTYHHADFVDERILQASRRGETIVVHDVETESRTEAAPYASIRLCSFVTVPFHRDGRWRFTLAVTDDRARDWRDDEVELIRQLADRVFPRLERAQAEIAAREAEARLRIAGEAARLGFWTWDLASSRVEVDTICCGLFGLEADEAVQRHMSTEGGAQLERYATSADVVLKRVHPEDQQWLHQAVKYAIEGLAPYDVEFRVIMPDGVVRWLGGKGDVQRDRTGQPRLMAGVNLDITARRAAEAALRASEERFRTMADTAPAMLWVTDRSDYLEFISRGWLEYTGQTQTLAYREGFGWLDQVHPEDREGSVTAFTQSSIEKIPFEIQYRLHRVDGAYRWALDAGRPRFDENGQWLGYIGSVIDIHEQKLALDALREADRRKDEFLATLAHELRNPLAPIRNALHLLDLVEGPAQTKRIRDMLQRQVTHMVRLVDDLMEASRISRGKLDLKLAPVSLADVLRDAVETSRPLIERAGHALQIHLPEEPLLVQGDAVRLTQVFANLLNNAAKYTNDGGLIELALKRSEGRAVVSVRDNGTGVSREHLPRLFEMFGQLDSTASRRDGGLGIGLALAKQLTEMHGGRIDAASAGVGHGSTFTVQLALIQAETNPAAAGPAPVAATIRHRILVVDDNQDAADSLALLLSFLGFEVRVVHGGAEALQACEIWHPTVILLDLGMPGMDGFEVARRLRTNPAWQDTKIVALTGWGQEQDRRSTEAAGFDHHLIKPVDINVLEALMISLG